MEQNGTEKQTGLTGRQLLALPYLIASPSLAEASRLANIGRTTLYRWLEDEEFRDKLEHLRAKAADLAHIELQGLMLKGVVGLAEAMEDPDPNIRLRASRAAVHLGLKAGDIKELRQRLDRLDDASTLRNSRNPI